MSKTAVRHATVIERSAPMRDGVELVLYEPEAANLVRPGQFFQLGVEAPHTLLRRPYSIGWTDPDRGRLAFIFSVVGAGSAWLASKDAGQSVELLGPLGKGFDVPPPGRTAVCVAGGLGIAAFPAFITLLASMGRPAVVLQGARTAAQLLPSARLQGAQVRVSTDDGSAGHPGPVTHLLPTALSGDVDVFMCGPTPMLRAVVAACGAASFPLERVQVAMETPMGCGLGTCLGCALPRAGGGYLLACQEGPCIRADRIDWKRMSGGFHDA